MENALDFGLSLVGTPYQWWGGGNCEEYEPMWTLDEPVPKKENIVFCNCAGLLNLIHRYNNKKIPYCSFSKGGTESYYIYYQNVSEDFNINKIYPRGTLIMKNYKDIHDQGHVAIILENLGLKSKILQSHIDNKTNGVTTFYDLETSHKNYNYQKAVLPENWII